MWWRRRLEGTPVARPRTSDASMAATGGIAAAEAAAIAEAEAVVVTTTITTNETMRTATAAARGRQQQSTIGHSWISTAFAICLDFNIDLTVSQIVEGVGAV